MLLGHIRRACKIKEVNAGGVHPSRRGVQVVQEESLHQEEGKETVLTYFNNCVYKVYCAKSIMNPFNCKCISMEYWSQ